MYFWMPVWLNFNVDCRLTSLILYLDSALPKWQQFVVLLQGPLRLTKLDLLAFLEGISVAASMQRRKSPEHFVLFSDDHEI